MINAMLNAVADETLEARTKKSDDWMALAPGTGCITRG